MRRIMDNRMFCVTAALCAGVFALPLAAWGQTQTDRERLQDRDQQRTQAGQRDRAQDQDRDRWDDQQRDQQRTGQQRDQDRQFEGRRAQRDQRFGDRRQDDRSANDEDPAGLGVIVAMEQDRIVVRRVTRDSPAEEAGIEEGDEILAIDGRRIRDSQQLIQVVGQQDPGSEVEIRIRRDGEEKTVEASLETRRDALGRDGERQAQYQQGRFQQDRQQGRFQQDRQQQGRFQEDRQQDRFQDDDFAGSPPWGEDQLLEHMDVLERQVKQLQSELEDMRAMLEASPDRQQQRGMMGRQQQQQRGMAGQQQRGMQDRQQFGAQQRQDRQQFGERQQQDRRFQQDRFTERRDRDRDWDDRNDRDDRDRD
jgi:hypothetical protein